MYSVASGAPVFYHLSGPSDDEVGDIVAAVASAVIDMLRKKKYIEEDGTEVEKPQIVDKIFAESEQLSAAVAASSTMRIAFGERAGQNVRRIGKGFGYEEEIPLAKGPRCFSTNGFTMHANRYIGQHEREKLKELVSYCARGAFSNKRLSLLDPGNQDGSLVYTLKSEWSDGTRAILLSATEMIEKIVALVPPPYVHLTRYFGVLSSHSKWRKKIVLKPHIKKGFVAAADGQGTERMDWSKLLAKVFKIDITRCVHCGAQIYPTSCETVTSPSRVIAILHSLGIKTRAPPISPARRAGVDPDSDQRPHYPEE